MLNLELDKPIHRMIAGPTGSGKSFFVGALVESLYDKEIPFIIFDTKTENHIGLQELHEVKVLNISPKRDYTKNIQGLLEHPYILCVPENYNIDIAAIIEIYREIINYLWIYEKEKRVFLIEEAHNYNKNSSVPDPLFERIAREGRGRGKFIWFITQRLQNFNQLLWSQCGATYLFRHTIPSDIRYISQMVPEFDWARNEDGARVPGINYNLNDHDVLVWDGRKKTIIPADQITRRTEHKG